MRRLALVTGASSGLGARTAASLSGAGADVVLTARDPERLQQTASGLSGSPLVIPGDLRDPAFRAALVDAVAAPPRRTWTCSSTAPGPATTALSRARSLAEVTDIIQLDLLAPIDLCRLTAPLLLATARPAR